MDELWKSVPQLSGFYEASNLGRLRRAKPGNGKTFVGRVCKTRMRGPYEYAYLFSTKRIDVAVHRLVCEAFHGLAPTGCEVNHKNQIKTDNQAENLEWITHSANVKQSSDKISAAVKLHRRNSTGGLNGKKHQ